MNQQEKKAHLEKSLKKHITEKNYFKFVNSPKQKRYRNNILFSIGHNFDGELQVGPMSTIGGIKIVDEARVNQNASQLSLDICKSVKRWIKKYSKLKEVIYPEFDGFWRHIIIKENMDKDYIISFRFNDFDIHQELWEKEKPQFIKYLIIFFQFKSL